MHAARLAVGDFELILRFEKHLAIILPDLLNTVRDSQQSAEKCHLFVSWDKEGFETLDYLCHDRKDSLASRKHTFSYLRIPRGGRLVLSNPHLALVSTMYTESQGAWEDWQVPDKGKLNLQHITLFRLPAVYSTQGPSSVRDQ